MWRRELERSRAHVSSIHVRRVGVRSWSVLYHFPGISCLSAVLVCYHLLSKSKSPSATKLKTCHFLLNHIFQKTKTNQPFSTLAAFKNQLIEESSACPTMNPPAHGAVEFTDTSAIFFCDKFHRMEGGSQLTCQSNGHWDRAPPTCIVHDCDTWVCAENEYCLVSNYLPSCYKC